MLKCSPLPVALQAHRKQLPVPLGGQVSSERGSGGCGQQKGQQTRLINNLQFLNASLLSGNHSQPSNCHWLLSTTAFPNLIHVLIRPERFCCSSLPQCEQHLTFLTQNLPGTSPPVTDNFLHGGSKGDPEECINSRQEWYNISTRRKMLLCPCLDSEARGTTGA